MNLSLVWPPANIESLSNISFLFLLSGILYSLPDAVNKSQTWFVNNEFMTWTNNINLQQHTVTSWLDTQQSLSDAA